MSGFRKPEIPREQLVLWAHRLEDALPVDHPVRQVDFLLHSAAFDETFRQWEGSYMLVEGKPPYHPRVLAGLYLYGMMNQIRSSRKLEAACYNRLDVIWLMSGQTPDHSTIAAFVTQHAKPLRKLFRDVLQVAIRAGLVKLEHVAVDGTKIEADAGKGSVHKQESIAAYLGKLDAQIDQLQAEWQANEKQETSLLGAEVPWTPAKDASVEQRLASMQRQQARLQESLKSIQRRQAENPQGKPKKAIASTTDPDSRVMRDKEGRCKPNYNAQLAVDAAQGVIVAIAASDATDDSGQLTPMLKEVEKQCGKLPEEISADSNYNTGTELAKLEEMHVTGYLPDSGKNSGSRSAEPSAADAALAAAQRGETLSDAEWSALPKDKEGRIEKAAFIYDAPRDAYRCPMGISLPFLRSSQDHQKSGVVIRRQYGGSAACATCARTSMCCKNPAKGRVVNRDQYEAQRERLRARMDTDAGRARYKLRGQTVEPRFGFIKQGMGVRRFLRRGLESIRTEWTLICTAVNLGVLLRNWEAVKGIG
jgi:transposase